MERETLAVLKILGALVAICLIASIVCVGLKGWPWFGEFLYGPAPSWIQGVGSVAAIFAVIWLGMREARLKARDERARAMVAGSALANPLRLARHKVVALSGALAEADPIGTDPKALSTERVQMLLEVWLPTEEQLLSLALAAPEIARDIASAQGHYTIALETLQALITLDEIEPAFYLGARRVVDISCKKASQNLNAASAALTKFLAQPLFEANDT